LCSLGEIRLGSMPIRLNELKLVLTEALVISFPVDEGKLVAS